MALLACEGVRAMKGLVTTSTFVARQNVIIQPPFMRLYRHHFSNQSTKGPRNTPETIRSKASQGGNVRSFIMDKFQKFVQGYERILEKRFPRAYRIYQIFSLGSKELYLDIKLLVSISSKLRQGVPFSRLSRMEIEKYHAMPNEMLRVAPVLLISALPFANYVVFPLAIMFPKQLLSSHFWSLQQKVEFAVEAHKQRLNNFRPVFRHLQSNVTSVPDSELQDKCLQMFHKLGSGTHPTVSEILEVKDVFSREPYVLHSLSVSHISSLCRLHRLSVFHPTRRRNLWKHANAIRNIDLAILREGLPSMNLDELRHACFLRGMNVTGMTKPEIDLWLTNWMTITKQLDAKNLSLLLHCPLLLAYNAPTNWSLIH